MYKSLKIVISQNDPNQIFRFNISKSSYIQLELSYLNDFVICLITIFCVIQLPEEGPLNSKYYKQIIETYSNLS